MHLRCGSGSGQPVSPSAISPHLYQLLRVEVVENHLPSVCRQLRAGARSHGHLRRENPRTRTRAYCSENSPVCVLFENPPARLLRNPPGQVSGGSRARRPHETELPSRHRGGRFCQLSTCQRSGCSPVKGQADGWVESISRSEVRPMLSGRACSVPVQQWTTGGGLRDECAGLCAA